MKPTTGLAALILCSAMAAGTAVAQEARTAEHPMEGEVVAIDHETGAVVVATEPIPMTVHFPAEHVQDLNVGDTITVHLSFEKAAE